jgi:hypothetical protein
MTRAIGEALEVARQSPHVPIAKIHDVAERRREVRVVQAG